MSTAPRFSLYVCRLRLLASNKAKVQRVNE